MNQIHDLGAMVFAAMLLLLCVSYLTQCSSPDRRPGAIAAATPPATRVESREQQLEREREAERRRKSVREFAAEEEKEEREKIKAVSRALQTAGANPEFRRTLGLPQ